MAVDTTRTRTVVDAWQRVGTRAAAELTGSMSRPVARMDYRLAEVARTDWSTEVPDDRESDTSRVFAAVVRRVLQTHPDDEPGRMLQSTGLKTGGKFYAFATAVDVVVKLPAPRVSELIESGRGAPCSPRPGRPMKEWVRIATPDEQACLSYVLEARAFVAALSAKGLKKASPA